MAERRPFLDVRMRGFRERADVAEVQAWVDAQPVARCVDVVALGAAAGRRLAAPLVADRPVPGFERAAMDGWALRGASTFGASPGDPLALDVIGVARPGHPFEGHVGAGQAVRIMTGAPMPDGADAVLRAEDGEERDQRLQAHAATAPRRHVGSVGEDIQPGDVVVADDRPLRPQDLGVAASLGHDALAVLRRPRVALCVTGDEVLPVGRMPDGPYVVDANGPMLAALVARDGGELVDHAYVPDDPEQLAAALEVDADLLLVTGGSSVGTEDHAPRLLAERGDLVFHGMAMRPAAPTGVGTLGAKLVALLPGNPVSCLAAYDLLLARWLRRAAALPGPWSYASCEGVLRTRIASALGRLDYVRVGVEGDEVEPLATRGASLLSTTTRADGFVLVPAASEGHAAGTPVTVWRY
ncbi:MAG: molybdopterin molybdotransferase MoeA [Planctomycetota bacterium]